MGRKPQSQESTDWEQVGEEAMLEAVESVLSAIRDGRMQKQDYFFKFCTANSNEYAGSCERRSRRSRELSKEMFEIVQSAFEAVGNGSLKEEDYYFELTTPYFQYESGCYPQQQYDETTYSEDSRGPESFRIWDYISPVRSQIKDYVKDVLPYQLTGKMKLDRLMNGISITLSTSGFSIRLFLALSVIMVHATPSSAREEPPLTLTAGQSGVIPFGCKNKQPSAPKYYTVKFEDKDRPFYIDGLFDTEGLMSPDQAGRFDVRYVENDNQMSIEINIASVSVEDQGTYIAILIVHGDTLESHTMKRAVFIVIPPGPAFCFIDPSGTLLTRYTIHCHSKRGNGNSTLSCFQKGDKIPYFFQIGEEQSDSQVVHKRKFWVMDIESPIFCCSHDISDINTITQALCDQYRFPYKKPEISTTPKAQKIATEITLTTRSLSKADEKNIPPYPSYSGCDRNSNRSALIISLAVLFIYACISNP